MSVPSEAIDRPRVGTGSATRPAARSRSAVSVSSRRRRRRITRGEWAAGIILGLLAFVGLFPFLFMFVASFKNNTQFYATYWAPAWPLHLDNYTRAWTQIRPYFLTTIIVAAISIVGTLILATTAGFVFARYKFPGRALLFGLIAALLMVPSIASLIPLFVLMRDLNLLNTRIVLALPQIAGNVVLATILIKTFTEGIPQELFDAARVDGASGPRMFGSIMLPLSLPVIGTVGLIVVINVWNDFFWPLLTVTQNNLRTVSTGLSFFQGQNVTSWGPLFAGYTLASVPLLILFTFLSRYFLAGVQGGVPSAGK
jgi:ABC-type glycerol-3-phosphate transport system permease component